MANPTTNLSMTKPTVGGSTDTWGTTLNENVVDIIDALFSISGTDVTMSDIKFNSMSVQETGAGTDTVKIQAPAAVTTSYTLTMPAAVGSTDQVLSAADGSGTLAWTTPETGDITAIVAGAGLTGTSLSGPIPTLNVIGTADKITVSADAVTIASGYVGQTSITTLGTIATGTWEGTTVAVDQGGTGATSLTDGGVLLGSGTGAITATAVLGDGVILIGDASGDPATLDVGSSTAITILGTVATGVWQGTAVANAYLANSAVSYGGISVSLGASDATPAFNLSDATAYPGDSSLVTVGTIASGVWNGTAITGAYIDPTSSPLANTKLWIGSASNVAAEFALSGDATMTAGGAVTVSTAAACSGLSATATALATARAINGTDFDGTAAITVTAAAGTVTGATLNSGVTASSLTSVGTLTSITSSGVLTVTNTGSHAIGGAVNPTCRLSLLGAWTSSGTYAEMIGTCATGALTAANGDTDFQAGQKWGNSIVCQAASESVAVVAQAYFQEPAITQSGATLPLTATVYIKDAPTEGTIANALHVASGTTQLQGSLLANASTNAIGGAVDPSSQLYMRGSLDFSGVNSSAQSLQMSTNLIPKVGYNGYGALFAPTFTEAGSGNHVLLAGARFNALSTTTGAATISDTSTVYIAGASTATVSGTNYSLWVDAGPVRMDGLPTSDPGDAGQLWANSGVVTVSAG